MIALRALGALLSYPRRELIEALPEIRAALESSPLLDSVRCERLQQLIAQLSRSDALELEQRYVSLFDTGRAMSLWLFEHVHGDSRDRGQAMVDLKSLYERAGFRLRANELPDYLPAVLEYLSYRELKEAREMLGDCAHILRAIGERLAAAGSCYAAVFDALLSFAGEPALEWSPAAAPDPLSADPTSRIDDDWMEAPAFGPGSAGCSAQRGVTPELTPLRFMPRRRRGEGAPP